MLIAIFAMKRLVLQRGNGQCIMALNYTIMGTGANIICELKLIPML